MLGKQDLEYLIEVLESGVSGHDNLITRGLIQRLTKFKDSTPQLNPSIDQPHCDGSRLVYRSVKREGLKP